MVAPSTPRLLKWTLLVALCLVLCELWSATVCTNITQQDIECVWWKFQFSDNAFAVIQGAEGTVSPTLDSHRDFGHELMMYVHVGKTGGTTLETVLRASCEYYDGNKSKFRSCLEQIQEGMGQPPSNRTHTYPFVESILSQRVKAILHMDPRHHYYEWIGGTQAFLVTVRNPISRLVSAFNYAHASNRQRKRLTETKRFFYLECFNTVEDFAQLLYRHLRGEQNKFSDLELKCLKVAKSTIQGLGPRQSVGHLYFNYEYYANLTYGQYPDRRLYIIRTERMWSDLIKLESSLGGDGNATFHRLTDTQLLAGSKFDIRSGLSAMGIRTMCCLISSESHMYEYLVRRGVNLEDSEKKEALAALYDVCEVSDQVVANQNYSDIQAAFDWEGWAKVTCVPEGHFLGATISS